jgi:Putative prokaryotic signal transducing protein
MKTTAALKDKTMLINGDKWTVVDIAPAAPLAEMVAVMLEQEGFPVIVRGTDVFSHLGASEMAATYVLVPEKDAARALELLENTMADGGVEQDVDEMDKDAEG